MRNVLQGRRLSPGLVISMIALLVSISGVAVALPGRNSVQSNDIGPGQQVRNADTRPITGAWINESTLGQVPNANNANSANSANSADNANTVGGNSVTRFAFNVASGTPTTQLFDVAGLQMRASCTAGAADLEATTSVNNGEISTFEQDATTGTISFNGFDDVFDVGDVFQVNGADHVDELGEVRYIGGDLRFATVLWSEEDSIPPADCVLNGHVIATG